eukprot:4813008-Prymnesium_polylepis.2
MHRGCEREAASWRAAPARRRARPSPQATRTRAQAQVQLGSYARHCCSALLAHDAESNESRSHPRCSSRSPTP